MPVPQVLVTRYFQLLVNRQFTEAERELERLKQKMQKTEWNRGYFRALFGMMLSRRANGDSYAFFSQLNLGDKEALQVYRREFSDHVKNRLHGDFDRGFFSAWSDFTRVISKMDVSEIPALNNGSALKEQDKTDESQATIEEFIEED
mgnify:CR=1 FL=1